MKDLKELMNTKDDKKDNMKKDAKLNVLQNLRKMASDMMGNDVKGGMEGLKKVTVASPDSEGLKLGLEKAKDMMSHNQPEESDEDPMEEASESPEEESQEEMTPEEIDEKIKELEALKHQMIMKR